MLKINAIKILINSTKGYYGLDLKFESGLNIIRGSNSSGKSTIFQSILYCLGLEEIIGSRNEKAMQSVLKNEILNDNKIKEAEVIESSIQLEIENNNKIVTIERFIKSESRDPRLVKVYEGALLSKKEKPKKETPMYVHDAGAATDVTYGFHVFLEKFLNFNLPLVQYNDNSVRKLYLQNIFPAFVIEQKVGWSDFLSTIPYFNLRDKEKRAIEFILKLDSWNIEERKQILRKRKAEISLEWNDKLNQIKELARRAASEINGIEENPSIINNINSIYLTYHSPIKTYYLNDYIEELSNEVYELESNEIPKIVTISKEREIELKKLTDEYNQYSVNYDFLLNRKNSIDTSLLTINERLKQIEEELYQNKQHQKLRKYGSQNEIAIANDICPTCGQDIVDSLMPTISIQMPMNIEENIGYLEAQRSMAISYLKNHETDIKSINRQLTTIENYSTQLRDKIRSIKKELVSDDRLPSFELIERRIKLKNRLNFYQTVKADFEKYIQELVSISKEWNDTIREESALPKDSFTASDYKKLKTLNENFIRLLDKFHYGSKSLDDLKISSDKLIPVAEGYYNIKFDSSASDLVRAIVAYTCSLFVTSNLYNGNHPQFFMFDEPGTQDTANKSLREMFNELQNYNAQTLVFASFKQSDADFHESTEGIKYNIINSEGYKYIRRL